MDISNEKEIDDFITEFSDKIINNEAAVFIGAGSSVSCGLPSWNKLTKKFSSELRLNTDENIDALQVAQFYENEKGEKAVKSLIKNTFSVDLSSNPVLSTLVKLPIHMYWTTNYDELIEKTFLENNKKLTVKVSNEELTKKVVDNVLYKMHGDVNHLQDVILTKNDYEHYDIEKPLFRDALKTSLMSHTFLFYGFGFSDPNLEFILSRMKIFLNNDSRIHYCIMEKENDKDKYIAQKLKIVDLYERYRIKTILIEKYGHDDKEIFEKINKRIKRKSVFISGSYILNSSDETNKYLENLSFELAKRLIKNSYKITSGFGLVIGSAVINGALTTLESENDKLLSDYLTLKPFPQNLSDIKERKIKFTEYRKEMISETGISIFIAGCKIDDNGKIINADGCLEEFDISNNNNNIIIPIPTTGYVAKKLFQIVEKDIDKYSYLEKYIPLLKTCK